MLGEIQLLLKERGSMSVKELALIMKTDPRTLHPMLAMLETKGRVEKVDLPCGGGCSSCNCADVDGLTYYKTAS